MKVKRRKIEVPMLYRTGVIDLRELDEDSRTIPVTFSTETPVPRWFGDEVLVHTKKAADLTRLRDVGSVLLNHDATKPVGKPERVRIEDRSGRADVRFGTSELASTALLNVQEEVVRGVSLGYVPKEMKLRKTSEGDRDVYDVTRWLGLEFSLTPIPLDANSNTKNEAETNDDLRELLEAARRDGRPIFECDVIEEVEESEERTMKLWCAKCGLEIAEGVESCTCGNRSFALSKPEPRQPAQAPVDGSDLRELERARIQAIRTCGERWAKHVDTSDLVRQFTDNGRKAEELEAVILERMDAKLTSIADIQETAAQNQQRKVGLNGKEVKRFSLIRLIRGLAGAVNGDKRMQDEATFELEACRAQADIIGRDPKGVFLPNEFVFGRDWTEQEAQARTVDKATESANLVTDEVIGSAFIDLLRNKSLMMNWCTVLSGLKNDLILPKLSTGASAAWVAESTANDQTATFTSLTMSPNTVIASTKVTRKLMIQSSPDVEMMLRTDLAKAIGTAIDLAVIDGTGASNQPKGFLRESGIGGVLSGGSVDWSSVVGLWSDVAGANADVGRLKFLTSPVVAGILMTTEKSGTYPVYLMGDDFRLMGQECGVTNQCPKTSPFAVLAYGNFEDELIGFWDAINLLVDPYSLGSQGDLLVRIMHEADAELRHAGSFSKIADIAYS